MDVIDEISSSGAEMSPSDSADVVDGKKLQKRAKWKSC